MKNKEFIEDLMRICTDLGYTTTMTYKGEGQYQIYILSEGTIKLYKDYLILKKEYPLVDLGIKGKHIQEFVNRRNKPKRYIPGNKEKIVIILEKSNLTINEIAKRMTMTRQGARYLIKELEKENKIKMLYRRKDTNLVYGVI
jgi:hypothetical protein